MSVTTAERRRVYPGLDQLVLRTLILLGVAAAIVAAQAAGARPGPWEQGIVFGLASITAVRPESIAGVGMLAGAAYVWALAPETLSPLVLVAAAGMILAHVSALVAAQGPARMGVDGAQVRRWAARGLLLWLAAAVGLGTQRGRRGPAAETARLRARADRADRDRPGDDPAGGLPRGARGRASPTRKGQYQPAPCL